MPPRRLPRRPYRRPQQTTPFGHFPCASAVPIAAEDPAAACPADRNYPHSFNFFDRQENVCVFFGRDRGDQNVSAKQTTLNELNNDLMVDYCYVYGLDNKWYYFSIGKLEETGLIELDLKKIIELLNEEE